MTPEEYQFLVRLLRDESGLELSEDKGYLLESRLGPVARDFQFDGLDSLVAKLRLGTDKALCTAVVEAMTTNESFFFRDIKPFESFRNIILPKLVEARRASGKKTLRVWSAACSSGQEPYTLAMIASEEAALLADMKLEIVATDLSVNILAKAEEGLYTQFEVQRGLPIQFLMKYFAQEGDHWRISPALRDAVSYRPFNLLDSFGTLGQFDMVFCRNVLIYFAPETKSDILGRIENMMANDGVVCLGGAESVIGITDKLKPISGLRGMYMKDAAANIAASAPSTPSVAPSTAPSALAQSA